MMQKILAIFLLVFSILAVLTLVEQRKQINEVIQTYKASVAMLNYPLDNRFALAGYYHYDKDFYCVLTKNRSVSEIATLEAHEICHALIDLDFKHFCEVR